MFSSDKTILFSSDHLDKPGPEMRMDGTTPWPELPGAQLFCLNLKFLLIPHVGIRVMDPPTFICSPSQHGHTESSIGFSPLLISLIDVLGQVSKPSCWNPRFHKKIPSYISLWPLCNLGLASLLTDYLVQGADRDRTVMSHLSFAKR